MRKVFKHWLLGTHGIRPSCAAASMARSHQPEYVSETPSPPLPTAANLPLPPTHMPPVRADASRGAGGSSVLPWPAHGGGRSGTVGAGLRRRFLPARELGQGGRSEGWRVCNLLVLSSCWRAGLRWWVGGRVGGRCVPLVAITALGGSKLAGRREIAGIGTLSEPLMLHLDVPATTHTRRRAAPCCQSR